MQAPIESAEEVSPSIPEATYPPATRLLRWVELRGLELDHGKLAKGQSEDGWWVAAGDEITGPHQFREVLEALRDGMTPLQVVHDSLAQEEAPPWQALQYRPLWLNPTALTLWTLGLWALLGLLGWMVIEGAAPRGARGVLNALFLPVPLWLIIRQIFRSRRPLKQPPGWGWVLPIGCLALYFALHLTPQSLREQGAAAWGQVSAYFQPAAPALVGEPTDLPETREIAAEPAAAEPAERAETKVERPVATTEAAAPPDAPVDLVALAQAPAEWPRTVLLTTARTFPGMLDGKVIGTVKLKPGTALKLVAIQGDQLTVEYLGAQQTIPVGDTGLLEQVKAARRATQASGSPGQNQPVASHRTAAVSATSAEADAELPGLPVRPASFFHPAP